MIDQNGDQASAGGGSWFDSIPGLNLAPSAGAIKLPTADQPSGGGMVGAPGTFTNAIPAFTSPGGIAGNQPASNNTDSSQWSDMQHLSSLLASYPNDPQQAIDIFNQNFPNNSVRPQYYPDKGVIGVAGQALPYLTAPGTTAGQTTWNFGGVPGGDSGAGNANGVPNPQNPAPFSYAPFTDTFSNPNFVAPTGLTEQNDPGYQARLALGAQQLQASAAGKGTLLSGQTANDLNQYAQNFASGEFGNVYNRALNDYQTNSQNNFQQYSQKYQQYLNGYQQALQGYNTNLGAGQQAFSDTLGLSAQNFGQNQQNWQNQFNTAQLGLNAAGLSANLGGQFANQAGGYLTGAGNANAAGQIGVGNAINYGIGNLTNLAAAPYFQSVYGAQKPPAQQTPYQGYTE